MLRRSLSPIFRLPSDVLVEIFRLVRDLTIESQVSPKYYSAPFPYNYNKINRWVAVSQVCHVWRETALNTPLLWAHIYISAGSFRWAEEMLRRSKQCLFIFFGTSDFSPNSDRVIRDLKNHLRRCRVLGLDQFRPGHFDDLFANDPAPHLEILIAFFDKMSPSYTLNDAFLRREPLRRLEVSNCRLDWDARFLQYLTHLKISFFPSSYAPTFNKFVATLSSIQSLEVLVLEGTPWIENIDTLPVAAFGNRKAYLQCLKYLDISCSSKQAACFLGSIILPAFCKLRLNIYEESVIYEGLIISEDLSFVLSWLSDRFQSPTSSSTESEIHLLSLCIRPFVGELSIQGFSEVVTHDQVISGRECPLVDLDASFGRNEIFLQQILDFLPVDRLIFLDIPFSEEFSKSFWVEVFGSIPTLKSIFLDINQSHFFSSLIPDSSNPTFTPFPALSSITLKVSMPTLPFDYDGILVGAIKRLEMGSPIQELLFSGRHSLLPDDIMTQLAQVVPRVGIDSPSQRSVCYV